MAILLGTRPVAAEPPPADERAFLASLDAAKAALADGRADAGLKTLQSALAAHAGKDYARAKRAALEDLARRLSFRAACPPPEPQSVVQGKLKRWNPRSGDLYLRYEAGQPHDFAVQGGQWTFPPRFRGPYTVSIRGDRYPNTAESLPKIYVGAEDDPKTHRRQAWAIGFGMAGATRTAPFIPGRILRVDGEDQKTLVEYLSPPLINGRPYKCDVAVTGDRISATVNSTSIGTVKKPEGVFGHAVFMATGWSEVVISGEVEPSWIQGRLDAAVEAKKKAFDSTFDVHDVLPAWLYEVGAASASDGDDAEPPTLASRNLPPALASQYAEARLRLAARDYDGAIEAARALEERGAPAGVAAMLAARAYVGKDEATKALAEAQRARAADPDALDALFLVAGLCLRLGRDDELAAALDAATARPDASTKVFEHAGRFFLLAGRLDRARALSEQAARLGRASERLDAIGRTVARVESGPDWPRSFEQKTPNYRVVSDIDPAMCRDAGRLLEECLAEYRYLVAPLRPDAQKRLYAVYLFSGEAGFQRYASESSLGEHGAPEHAAGLYSPTLKQLLIWNLPRRDEMLKTIRHEGFHQYLDRLLPDPPVWFNEGLAVYFEVIPRVAGAAHMETPRFDQLEVLKDGRLEPLAAFLRISPRDFYANAPRTYAQAWLVVHMLRHGSTKHREMFKTLLARLRTSTGSEAVRATFDDETTRALDVDLRAYLQTLRAAK